MQIHYKKCHKTFNIKLHKMNGNILIKKITNDLHSSHNIFYKSFDKKIEQPNK